MNSSALSRSPLKVSRGLPTSLSPRPPGTTGAGGRGRVLAVLHLLGIRRVVLHLLGIHRVVLPWEVLPIQMGLWEVCFSFLVCLGGLLDQVLLLGIGPRHLH
jgi:hypothetical protein